MAAAKGGKKKKVGHSGSCTFPSIIMFRGETFTAAQWLRQELGVQAPPLCLDFASDTNPGGGYKSNQ